MPTTPWQTAADALASALRARGIEPDKVNETAIAWEAFTAFAQQPLEGLAGPDEDGIIVQWGRWSHDEHQPCLSFTRQLIADDDEQQMWQVSLELIFSESTETAAHADAHTGFDFAAPGPGRAKTLHRVRTFAPLRTALALAPVRSRLTVDQV